MNTAAKRILAANTMLDDITSFCDKLPGARFDSIHEGNGGVVIVEWDKKFMVTLDPRQLDNLSKLCMKHRCAFRSFAEGSYLVWQFM